MLRKLISKEHRIGFSKDELPIKSHIYGKEMTKITKCVGHSPGACWAVSMAHAAEGILPDTNAVDFMKEFLQRITSTMPDIDEWYRLHYRHFPHQANAIIQEANDPSSTTYMFNSLVQMALKEGLIDPRCASDYRRIPPLVHGKSGGLVPFWWQPGIAPHTKRFINDRLQSWELPIEIDFVHPQDIFRYIPPTTKEFAEFVSRSILRNRGLLIPLSIYDRDDLQTSKGNHMVLISGIDLYRQIVIRDSSLKKPAYLPYSSNGYDYFLCPLFKDGFPLYEGEVVKWTNLNAPFIIVQRKEE